MTAATVATRDPWVDDFGEVVLTKTLEKRTGKVVVTEYERGFTIEGGSTIWWQSDHTTPWGKFTAEIKRCDRHSDGNRGYPPVCGCHRKLTVEDHRWNERPTAHAKTNCHELGHIERVLHFADKVLRTY